jgi:hypothetical protein
MPSWRSTLRRWRAELQRAQVLALARTLSAILAFDQVGRGHGRPFIAMCLHWLAPIAYYR